MKIRLDQYLVENGYFTSRQKAQSAIMTGRILIGGQKVTKSGTMIKEDVNIEIIGNDMPFVSRGGLKLDKAVKEFDLQLEGRVMMDIGASTGGFTHCALLNGVNKVYAVDVGYGQLAWELRQDERVVTLERTNARYLTKEQIPEMVDVITIDASFISLSKLVPPLIQFLKEDGNFVVLIKPQFEAGRDNVGKKGVVKDKKIHCDVINGFLEMIQSVGLYCYNISFSPIRGPEGNIEYLAKLGKYKEKEIVVDVAKLVEDAFGSFTC